MPKLRQENDNQSMDNVRPGEQAIAKRAYELYLQRGSTPGYELDDWLEAEAELIAEAIDRGRATREPASAAEGTTPAAPKGSSRRREASATGSRRAART